MKTIESYKNYKFSSDCYTQQDYLEFQCLCRRSLANQVKRYGFKVHSFNKNHYCWSAVLERNGKFVYVSMNDVRWNLWYDDMLVRTMEHEKDWSGGYNNKCSWDEIGEIANKISK